MASEHSWCATLRANRLAAIGLAFGSILIAAELSGLGIEFVPALETLKSRLVLTEGHKAHLSLVWSNPSDETESGFQWYHNQQPIAGATSPDLKIAQTSIANSGTYFVRSATAESNRLTLDIRPAGSDPLDRSFFSPLPDDGSLYDILSVSPAGTVYIRARRNDENRVLRISPDGELDRDFEINTQHMGPSIRTHLANGGFILSTGYVSGTIPVSGGGIFSSEGSIISVDYPEDGGIDAATTLASGRTIIAQNFRETNNGPSRFRLFPLDANGNADGGTFRHTRRDGTVIQLNARPTGGFYATLVAEFAPPTRRWRIDLFDDNGNYQSFNQIESPHRILVQAVYPDGRFIVGFDGEDSESDYTYRRFHADGRPDASFPPIRSRLDVLSNVHLNDRGDLFVSGNFWTDGYVDRWQNFAAPQRIDFSATRDYDPNFFVPEAHTFTSYRTSSRRWLYAAGDFHRYLGHESPALVRFDTHFSAPAPPPEIEIFLDHNPAGFPQLGSDARSNLPVNYEWLALDGQLLPAANSSPELVFPSFDRRFFGRYQLKATNANGASWSNVVHAPLRTNVTAPRLVNLSGRAWSAPGEHVATAGFVLSPAGNPGVPRVFLRGIGSSLGAYGIDPIDDPSIRLYDATGRLEGENDNWDFRQRGVSERVGAFRIGDYAPDSALLAQLPYGAHTLTLETTAEDTGIGLLEIYNVDHGYELRNLSLRGYVGLNEQTLIGGFVVDHVPGDETPAVVLIRAIGPGLSSFGVNAPLADPVIEVFDSAGTSMARNISWLQAVDSDRTEYLSRRIGAFPITPRDAAVVIEVTAGSYTAHVTGANSGTGIALLEIYQDLD